MHARGRKGGLGASVELRHDLAAVRLVADDDHGLSAPGDGGQDVLGRRARRERLFGLGLAETELLRCLARTQKRAGEDRVGIEPVGEEALAEPARLLPSLSRERAELVRAPRNGLRMANEHEPQLAP